jgi:hypothetical protein
MEEAYIPRQGRSSSTTVRSARIPCWAEMAEMAEMAVMSAAKAVAMAVAAALAE